MRTGEAITGCCYHGELLLLGQGPRAASVTSAGAGPRPHQTPASVSRPNLTRPHGQSRSSEGSLWDLGEGKEETPNPLTLQAPGMAHPLNPLGSSLSLQSPAPEALRSCVLSRVAAATLASDCPYTHSSGGASMQGSWPLEVRQHGASGRGHVLREALLSPQPSPDRPPRPAPTGFPTGRGSGALLQWAAQSMCF